MSMMTRHAVDRARTRQIPPAAIAAAIEFGQHRVRRGADVYTLGWRQVQRLTLRGVDVTKWEGTEVVCSRDDGRVLTAYRNRNRRAFGDPARRLRLRATSHW